MATIHNLHTDLDGDTLELIEFKQPADRSDDFNIRVREANNETVLHATLNDLIILRNALDDILHERI